VVHGKQVSEATEDDSDGDSSDAQQNEDADTNDYNKALVLYEKPSDIVQIVREKNAHEYNLANLQYAREKKNYKNQEKERRHAEAMKRMELEMLEKSNRPTGGMKLFANRGLAGADRKRRRSGDDEVEGSRPPKAVCQGTDTEFIQMVEATPCYACASFNSWFADDHSFVNCENRLGTRDPGWRFLKWKKENWSADQDAQLKAYLGEP